MNDVQILPLSISSLLSSGQIIRSPANILKELLDNSVDAQSKNIEIVIQNGGLDRILVKDDGIGIPFIAKNIITNKHATSKISSVDDIYNIKTLGFKGEALNAIKTVSNLKIESFESNKGFLWDLGETKTIFGTKGTRIEITDLFKDLNAKKFLKKPFLEMQKCLRYFKAHAIGFPHISYSLIYEKEIISYEKNTWENRHRAVMPNLLHHFEMKKDHISIKASFPDFSASKTNTTHFIIINGHLVENKLVEKTIKRFFKGRISGETIPYIFCLDLEKDIDINVHPDKSDVRFLDEKYIENLIYSFLKTNFETSIPNFSLITSDHSGVVINMSLPNGICIGSYENDLYLIDPHGAQERILFDKFMDDFKAGNNKQFGKIEFDDLDVIFNYINDLKRFGFIFENKLLIEWPVFSAYHTKSILLDIFNSLDSVFPEDFIEIFARLACRKAIKNKSSMDLKLVQEICNTLVKNKIYKCPHGRNVFVKISENSILKLFDRV